MSLNLFWANLSLSPTCDRYGVNIASIWSRFKTISDSSEHLSIWEQSVIDSRSASCIDLRSIWARPLHRYMVDLESYPSLELILEANHSPACWTLVNTYGDYVIVGSGRLSPISKCPKVSRNCKIRRSICVYHFRCDIPGRKDQTKNRVAAMIICLIMWLTIWDPSLIGLGVMVDLGSAYVFE